jgi:hypothetical protein
MVLIVKRRFVEQNIKNLTERPVSRKLNDDQSA